MFLPSNQLFKRKGISFFCVLQEEGHGEVFTGFFRLLDFVLLVLQWIFFPICAKNLFLKRGRASLELSTLWGQSSFKQCSWNWGSKEMLPLRSAQCSKKVADGPIKKNIEKVMGAPMN